MEDDLESEASPSPFGPAQILNMLSAQWRLIAAFTVVVVVVAGAASWSQTPEYKATAVVRISRQVAEEVNLNEVLDAEQQVKDARFITTRIQLAYKTDFLKGLWEKYFREQKKVDLGRDPGSFAQAVGGRLKIMPQPTGELFDLSVSDTSPQRATYLANLISQEWVRANLQERIDRNLTGRLWTQSQEVLLKKGIAEKEAELVQYQRANDLADAESDLTPLSSAVDQLNQAYGGAITERAMLETNLKEHEGQLRAKQCLEVAKEMKTLGTEALLTVYSAALAERAQMRARYKDQYPAMEQKDAGLRELESQICEKVRQDIEGERIKLRLLQERAANLDEEINGAKRMMLDRQVGLQGYYQRKLEIEAMKHNLQQLVKASNDLALAANTEQNNMSVWSPAAVPTAPATPNIPRNLLIAALVGLVGGVVLAVLREAFNDTVSSPLDVTSYLKVPFLGFLPRIDAGTDDRARALYVHYHPNSAPAEAMRAVRTLIELNPAGRPVRRLLVTSSVSSEGKTNTTTYLATSFAHLGKRVLIIDADLRRPRMHVVFGLPKDVGLSNTLGGLPWEGAVHPTEVPRLDVMTAGSFTERPNEMLASAAMEELLEQLGTRYDLVLVDTPPSAMLSDAATLSKVVDGVVVVARENTVSRRLVRDVVQNLQKIGAPLLGVLVNAVDTGTRSSKYKYYYGYRYRYDAYYQEQPTKAAGK